MRDIMEMECSTDAQRVELVRTVAHRLIVDGRADTVDAQRVLADLGYMYACGSDPRLTEAFPEMVDSALEVLRAFSQEG